MKNKGQIAVELQEFMGSDRSIAEAAWTSSTTKQGKDKRTDEDVSRIVEMLAREGHATPFESIVLRFWIKMPISIDRQHMTHRIGSHNGMSGRYRTMPSEFMDMPGDVETILIRANNYDELKADILDGQYRQLCKTANGWYQEKLEFLKSAENKGFISNNDYKRAREFLRGVLPQNNMTERVTVFNLRSFANYMRLRDSAYAQPEIKTVAQLMLEEVIENKIAPVAIKALQEMKWRI